jgi:peptidoglycan/xylan/chitin deacetylase (PgdA/CDA1 family)
MYGSSKLRSIARRMHQRLSRSGIILIYHRVTELRSDPWSLAVTPAHFAEHLDVLRRQASAMRLDRYVRAREERHLPRFPVVITFDDGYADNFHEAKPLLTRFDLPATVFISTDYVGADREFWWDELDRLLLQPGRLPRTLVLTVDGREQQWELGADAEYDHDAQGQHRGWRFWHEAVPTRRHHLYRELWQLLQALPLIDRQKVMEELRLWSGQGDARRSTHRIMTPDEVRALAADGLVEVGSHTVTHVRLSAVPPLVQRQEIQQSKWCLEEILGTAVRSFAYPYGNRSMYTAATVALVQQAGYASACSNFPGMVESSSSCFELPRIRVHDWTGEEFSRKLQQVIVEGHA